MTRDASSRPTPKAVPAGIVAENRQGLGHSPQGVGSKHYNRIDLDLIQDYNEALDAALEEAFQEEKIKLRGMHVAPGSKPVSC